MKNAIRVISLCACALAGVGLIHELPAQTIKETTPPKSPKETTRVETKLAPAPSSAAHELTGTDVESFLDGMMPSQLQRENIAGATIAVVKDGKLIFAKGYGFSDVEKRTPVTADSTLFRPGSISKLFTWTSVLQLAEQGKVDLDRDVNEYLNFKIPPAYGKPITLKNRPRSLCLGRATPVQPREISEATRPRSDFPAGSGSSVFKLRDRACRLHCSARFGEVI